MNPDAMWEILAFLNILVLSKTADLNGDVVLRLTICASSHWPCTRPR